ncbi:ABC transporter permease [Paenibacillus sp. MMS20-IR301]|nr:ABC transporter permease [Paenibacillus sp. MMS20-IR301]WNS45080.1 ABC transporter permease [Paenibacillus sp. MMS20-IR301]
MNQVLKLTKHECRDFLHNPSFLILFILPVFMSKILIAVMDNAGLNFMLLSTWILFAEVMVGIMLTGPSLLEERESRTFDALLVSPLGKGQILAAKGMTVLLFSLLAQIAVYLVNQKLNSGFLAAMPYMLAGGLLFVEVGMIIGLKLSSAKNGSAVSSAVMIVFFLIVSVYGALPDWTYPLFIILPSIALVENLNSVMSGNAPLLVESLLLLLWITGLTVWIWRIDVE